MGRLPWAGVSALTLAAAGLAAAVPVHACWEDAGQRYGINPQLLVAIARTESGLNPKAINRNRNGSMDVGLMQINSSWLPKLAEFGIRQEQLYDPCTSIHVGAWILAHNIRRHGNSWGAVGAYNAVSPDKQRVYARKVYNNLPPALREQPAAPAQPGDSE